MVIGFWILVILSSEPVMCFPTINVAGTLKHLQLMPHELVEYENQVEDVLRRYLKRLQWLLSGKDFQN